MKRGVLPTTAEACHPCARDRHVDDLARAEPAMVVDHVQHPEPPVIGELVAHEVEGPALHRPVRRLNGDPIPSRQLAALLRADLQTLLDVEGHVRLWFTTSPSRRSIACSRGQP
jgi:hypothetical protein